MHQKEQYNRSMPIKCAVWEQNYIWISCYLYNGLYCFDIMNNRLEYKGTFDNQYMGENIHRQVIAYGDRLFFIPLWGKGIDVYNIKKECFEDTIYDEEKKITNRIAVKVDEKTIFLVAQNIRETLYVLHLESGRLEKVYEWKERIERVLPEKENYYVPASGIAAAEGKIYFVLLYTGLVLEINVATKEIGRSCYQGHFFTGLAYSRGVLCLVENGSTKVSKVENGKLMTIERKDMPNVKYPYSGMVQVKNGWLLIPHKLGDFYLWNVEQNVIQNTHITFSSKEGKEPHFYNWQVTEDKIIFYPGSAKKILIIDTNDMTWEEIEINIPEEISDEWIAKNRFDAHCSANGGVLRESIFGLDEFITRIGQKA